jgi:hypothetical protein
VMEITRSWISEFGNSSSSTVSVVGKIVFGRNCKHEFTEDLRWNRGSARRGHTNWRELWMRLQTCVVRRRVRSSFEIWRLIVLFWKYQWFIWLFPIFSMDLAFSARLNCFLFSLIPWKLSLV